MKQKLSKKEIGFTQIKNEVLKNENLSLKAKGLFSLLYSKPDDWDFSMHRIKDESTDGKESVRMGLKELEDEGYLTREREYGGKMSYYLTYEPNSDNRNKTIENTKTDNRNKLKSQQVKIGTVSNKEKIVIKKNTNTEEDGVVLEEVEDTYKSKHKIAKQKGIKLKVTPRTTKQEQSADVMKSITYYRNQAMLIHGMQFMKVQDESRNKAVRNLAIKISIDGKLNDLIDWWLDGAGEWAGYEPEQCFSPRMVERFVNRDKASAVKVHNL